MTSFHIQWFLPEKSKNHHYVIAWSRNCLYYNVAHLYPVSDCSTKCLSWPVTSLIYFLYLVDPILYPLPATSRYTKAWDWFKNTQTTDFFCFRLSAYTFEGIIFLRLFIIWKSRASDLWTSKNPTQKWKN